MTETVTETERSFFVQAVIPVIKEIRLMMPKTGTATSHQVKLVSPIKLNVGAWSNEITLAPKTRKRITAKEIRKII